MLPPLWDCLRCPELTHHCLTSLLTSPDTGNHPQPMEPFLLGASLSWEFMWHQPTAPALPSQGGTATPQLLFTASSTPCPFFVLILEYSHTMQAPSTPAISTTDHFLHIASLNYSAFILNSFSRYLLALKTLFSKQRYHSQQAGNKDSHPEFLPPKPWLLHVEGAGRALGDHPASTRPTRGACPLVSRLEI